MTIFRNVSKLELQAPVVSQISKYIHCLKYSTYLKQADIDYS